METACFAERVVSAWELRGNHNPKYHNFNAMQVVSVTGY
jgi:hypothetical protein